MHEVKVNREDLLEKLKANREKHVDEYKKAMRGYIKRLEKTFVFQLAELEAGRIPELNPKLPKPEDHAAEYDRVITMVEMSVEDELTLSSHEFAQFVMDNWDWKTHFTQTMAMYSG